MGRVVGFGGGGRSPEEIEMKMDGNVSSGIDC